MTEADEQWELLNNPSVTVSAFTPKPTSSTSTAMWAMGTRRYSQVGASFLDSEKHPPEHLVMHIDVEGDARAFVHMVGALATGDEAAGSAVGGGYLDDLVATAK